MGSDDFSRAIVNTPYQFQSTLPGWGATGKQCVYSRLRPDFNPRSPDGERRDGIISTGLNRSYFNPRSPDGERLADGASRCRAVGISIHAPRMGSDIALYPSGRWLGISIHAPRMGSDKKPAGSLPAGSDFNPRSPDGERLQHATINALRLAISIHAPRMGSDISIMAITRCIRISIHAPRMGSDHRTRESTRRSYISIHAPRMGSDAISLTQGSQNTYFNPRSPDGERLRALGMILPPSYFNPRSPDGERHSTNDATNLYKNFNPRSPDGERLQHRYCNH